MVLKWLLKFLRRMIKLVLDIPGGLFGQDDVRETAAFAGQAGTGMTVTDGVIGLSNKTSYMAIPGLAFKPATPDDTNHHYTNATGRVTDDTGADFGCPIILPHGAVVTNVQVYGSTVGAETWTLRRVTHTGGTSDLASANIGSGDSSISNATIDNATYFYFIYTSTLAATDSIYGAAISYTTYYD